MTNSQRQKLQEAIREVREKYYEWVANEIKTRPGKSYRQIASEFGVSEQTVYTVARINGLSRNSEAQSPIEAPMNIISGVQEDGDEQ
jgi:DNA invertase Pin-like site-specific DNA recombinase